MATKTPEALLVPKGVMGALVGGIVLCLVLIAFLLGRQSAPRGERATVSAPEVNPQDTATDPLLAPSAGLDDEPTAPVLARSPDPLPEAASTETVVRTDSAEALVSDADRAAVGRELRRRYGVGAPSSGGRGERLTAA